MTRRTSPPTDSPRPLRGHHGRDAAEILRVKVPEDGAVVIDVDVKAERTDGTFGVATFRRHLVVENNGGRSPSGATTPRCRTTTRQLRRTVGVGLGDRAIVSLTGRRPRRCRGACSAAPSPEKHPRRVLPVAQIDPGRLTRSRAGARAVS